MSNFTHRVCPATGLRIHSAAENLIKANAVVAVIFLAVGGFFGLLVALTRWPGVHLLPADLFYLVLTGHGLDVLLVWIIFFEMAVLYFASAILLNSRIATPRWAWTGFALMLIGAADDQCRRTCRATPASCSPPMCRCRQRPISTWG